MAEILNQFYLGGSYLNKTLFGVSLVGLIFSFIFMIVSIWNNTDWMLLERGYYTFGIITVTVSVYIAIQLTLDFKVTGVLGKLNMAICSIFAGVAIIFMAISIRNTEWVLLEKGYYWMGLAFVVITSAMVASTIKTILSGEKV